MQSPPIIEERYLLRKLRDGDYAAFDELYNNYKRRIAANLYRLLKSRELVEDVLQELFTRLWENRDKIDVNQSIKPYLFKVAENLVIDLYRKTANDRKYREHLSTAFFEAYDHIGDQLQYKQTLTQLYDILGKLSPQRRKVVTMCKIEGRSYDEVARMLGISTSAVNDHIYKANRFLKQYATKHPDIIAGIIASVMVGC